MKKIIILISLITIIIVNIWFAGRKQITSNLISENIEALAFIEEDENGFGTKVEEEESHDYSEIHGKCIFYYSIKTTTTICYDKGKISCTSGIEVGDLELIDINCDNISET